MAVRYGLPTNPGVQQVQLAALDKLRTDENIVLAISGRLTGDEGPGLALTPVAALPAGAGVKAAACAASLRVLNPARK